MKFQFPFLYLYFTVHNTNSYQLQEFSSTWQAFSLLFSQSFWGICCQIFVSDVAHVPRVRYSYPKPRHGAVAEMRTRVTKRIKPKSYTPNSYVLELGAWIYVKAT